ncbi:MAG: acyl-[acyl-carrier-protein] thioesterase [Bacteroidota bacterium]
MKETHSILEKNYQVSSLNIDTNKRLSLFGLLGILQDAAWEHASILGFGYESALEKGFFWALIRQKLKMETWPTWHEQVTLKTWTRPVAGIYATREFELFVNDQKIGACSTTWVILDSETRRPKILERAELLYKPRIDYSLGFAAEKIVPPKELKSLKTFEVEISDLDINQHVNNIKYAQWMLDSIPFKDHQKMIIRDYEINFLAEAFLGDHVEILSNMEPQQSKAEPVSFQGIRQNDSKAVFTARIISTS